MKGKWDVGLTVESDADGDLHNLCNVSQDRA